MFWIVDPADDGGDDDEEHDEPVKVLKSSPKREGG